ncbi:MAG: glycosyltransferase family 2 protein, partial [Chloroflexi bacterium]|nr:glycosyltransferase family 2 protein [Chloroflexota bacterium]
MSSEPNSPLVSIVILNYNGQSCLEDCLNSVLETKYPNFEVILVDNASKDNSLKMAQEVFGADPRLKIVKHPTNVGFSGGNNIGYDYSKGEYIVFLNNDTIVDPDWLAILVSAMQNDPTIGLAQSMILNIGGDKIQTAGWLFSNYLIHKYQLCKDKPSNLKFQPVFEVSFACGASMMIKREVAEDMGLFDPKMPFFYDDTLLSLKTWLAQKRVVTVSGSKIRHVGGATNVWNIKFTTFHLLKSNICLLFDIYPKLTDLSKALLVNYFSISINSLFCLKNKNVAAVLGNIHALGWSLKNFGYVWQNR